MECPDCGYMMTAFDQDCPRCARYGKPVQPVAVAEEKPQPGQSGLICKKCRYFLLINSCTCLSCGFIFSEPTPPWTSLLLKPVQAQIARDRYYYTDYDKVPLHHNCGFKPGAYWWPAPSPKAMSGPKGTYSGYVCGLCCAMLYYRSTSCTHCGIKFNLVIDMHPAQKRR